MACGVTNTLIDTNPATPEVDGVTNLRAGGSGESVAVSGNQIYVASYDGNVYIFTSAQET